MIEREIKQNDIDEFLRLVTPPLRGKIKAKSRSAPDPKNAYKVKGQKAFTHAARQFQAKPGFKGIGQICKKSGKRIRHKIIELLIIIHVDCWSIVSCRPASQRM